MLIALTGVDGSGKSSQAHVLHDAFEVSHVRSRIVWMRMGDTFSMHALRVARRRHEERNGIASKRTFNRKGWRLVLWLLLASAEYAAWLQHVRWLLWRGDVVVADRYLYDFEVELTIRLEKSPRFAKTLLASLRRLAPKPKRAYLLRVDPELSRRRRPEPDFKGLDPADLQPRYESLVHRYGLSVFDGSCPLEDVSSAIVRDVWTSYMEESAPLVRS